MVRRSTVFPRYGAMRYRERGVPSALVYAPGHRSHRRTCCDRLLGGVGGVAARLRRLAVSRRSIEPCSCSGAFCRAGGPQCAFAFVADAVRPKRFAGLFAAAPLIAIATLALIASTSGADLAAIEQRSELSYGDERSGCAPGASRRATARERPRSEHRHRAVTHENGACQPPRLRLRWVTRRIGVEP
jgi:hypothetical protein